MKIIAFDNLVLTLKHRPPWQTVILCHGCFDILHIGHIRHFESAKRLASLLVVSITPDIYVNKGNGRPIFKEGWRAEAVASIRDVDYVVINQWPSAVETIQALKPAFYCKGIEFQDNMTEALQEEKKAIENVGGKLIFAGPDITHSSEIIDRLANPFASLEGELC